MSIVALHTSFPSHQLMQDVLIEIIRNPNVPSFVNNFLAETVYENVPLGTLVCCVSAVDNDGDIPSYTITSVNTNKFNQVDTDIFFLTSDGCIYVKRFLDHSPASQYTLTIRARDHCYPEKFGKVPVQINILRNGFTPRFESVNYFTTIQETEPVNSTVPFFTVHAIGNDLQVKYSFSCIDIKASPSRKV